MKISYNWLKDYIDTDLSPERLAEVLTEIGLEAEGLEKTEGVRGGLEGVVVGKVLTCAPHPDSDHLHVTTVDVGAAEPLDIVCGAPNVAAGQTVPVATVGAVLYPSGSEQPMKIKRSRIRGVESLGMICAADELGLGSDHDGIMVFDTPARPGTPVRDLLGIRDDWTIEIGLTPNRADAASHYGVARDLAAALRIRGFEAKLSLPSTASFSAGALGEGIAVEVADTQGAPRYAGLTVEGVKVGPSPEWMQNYLKAIGINPKNNIVDITNFVLHEIGQPLHAFDADKIKAGKIVVGTVPEGTRFVTLDGTERTLSGEDLMICDAEKPMCIAGVFGGIGSGVTESTSRVFIESAYFDPVRIRKTARRHGLSTDASFRYERGIDPNITLWALRRAALLIQEYASGKTASGITDIYPAPAAPFRFEASLPRINALIGKDIPRQTVTEIMSALEISVESEHDGILSVSVPPYRVDVRREADLAEEILRLYGYNNVEIPERMTASLSSRPGTDKDRLRNIVSDLLTSRGFTEVMNNSLTRAAYYEGLSVVPPERSVRLLNPLSADLNAMRQTLLFGMLETAVLNINRRRADLKLYELGNVYRYDSDKAGEGDLAPYGESERLGVLVAGQWREGSWNEQPQQSGFFDLKAAAERILERFGTSLEQFEGKSFSDDLFGEGMVYTQGNRGIRMGSVSGKVLRMFDIKSPVWYMEADFSVIIKAASKVRIAAKELPRFPEVRRDLALLIDKNVTYEQLREIAFATERKLLKSVALFDVYEGDKLPESKKSYALAFRLQDSSRTLTDQTIDRAMNNLIDAFAQKTGAVIR